MESELQRTFVSSVLLLFARFPFYPWLWLVFSFQSTTDSPNPQKKHKKSKKKTKTGWRHAQSTDMMLSGTHDQVSSQVFLYLFFVCSPEIDNFCLKKFPCWRVVEHFLRKETWWNLLIKENVTTLPTSGTRSPAFWRHTTTRRAAVAHADLQICPLPLLLPISVKNKQTNYVTFVIFLLREMLQRMLPNKFYRATSGNFIIINYL